MAGGRLCDLYEKMRGVGLSAKLMVISAVSLAGSCPADSPGSLNPSQNLQAIAITPAGRCKQQKRKDEK